MNHFPSEPTDWLASTNCKYIKEWPSNSLIYNLLPTDPITNRGYRKGWQSGEGVLGSPVRWLWGGQLLELAPQWREKQLRFLEHFLSTDAKPQPRPTESESLREAPRVRSTALCQVWNPVLCFPPPPCRQESVMAARLSPVEAWRGDGGTECFAFLFKRRIHPSLPPVDEVLEVLTL